MQVSSVARTVGERLFSPRYLRFERRGTISHLALFVEHF